MPDEEEGIKLIENKSSEKEHHEHPIQITASTTNTTEQSNNIFY